MNVLPHHHSLWMVGLLLCAASTHGSEPTRHRGSVSVECQYISVDGFEGTRGKIDIGTTDTHSRGGEKEAGRRVATFMRDHMQAVLANGGEASWWPNLLLACALMQLDEPARALEHLETLPHAAALPWDAVLKDSGCFQPLAREPRYRAVLATLDQRRADQRARLPTTLARDGITPP